MLTTDFDITAMRESVKAIKQFVGAPAWSDYVIAPVGNLSATSDAGIDAYVRQATTTIFHPSGTASMTSKNSAKGVVNPDLTVKGAEGLRIVDLSVVVSVFVKDVTENTDSWFPETAIRPSLPSSRACLLTSGKSSRYY